VNRYVVLKLHRDAQSKKKNHRVLSCPINFSGEIHYRCQDEEQTYASNQERIIFQLYNHINEAVQNRKCGGYKQREFSVL